MTRSHLPHLLLVEGNDDRNVIRNLWLARQTETQQERWCNSYWRKRDGIVFCPETAIEFEIQIAGEPGGVEPLIDSLPDYLKERPATLACLGIVVDADLSLQSRWDEIAERLRRVEYQMPPSIPDDGLLIEHPTQSRPRVGIWIMPDNHSPGKLEDFVRLLIPPVDRLVTKADATLNEIQQAGCQLYTDADRPKALIHTWLAWQSEPGWPMGQAITQKALAADSPYADAFVRWLQRLFCEQNNG